MIQRIKDRIIKHWQTSLSALLLLIAYIWFHTGKIEFDDFKEYLILIPTIILLFMKDWKKK